MEKRTTSRETIKNLVLDIGGETRLLEILNRFYERMSNDTMIGYFFAGKDLKAIAFQQSEFILNAAGLRDRFEGKGPSTAHIALPPIWKGHFDRRLVILRELLNDEKLSPELIDRWIQFEESFRSIVVT